MGSETTVKILNVAGIVVLAAAIVSLIAWRAHVPVTVACPEGLPREIANEQLKYAWLFVNWTITDWVLTILAAGTAVGAAVKNAFSAHNQAQAAAAGANPPQAPPANGVDKWVMTLAALTIIATTLDAKIHPSVQADRYRRGDLILQEALMDYAWKNDQAPLVAAWHRAEKILQGLDAPAVAPPADTRAAEGASETSANGTHPPTAAAPAHSPK